MTDCYVYDAVRTPRGRGKKDGSLHGTTAVEMATQVLEAVRDRNNLDTALLDDVVMGCVDPVGEQGSDIARAAVLKALSLTAMALWVLGSTAYHVLVLGIPRAEVMGIIGVLALVANAASVLILMRYKDGDANVRSVWLCSRNDAIGNVAVMIAALAVWGTATKWPDLLVAAIMAGLFLYSSIQILRQSFREMREGRLLPAE